MNTTITTPDFDLDAIARMRSLDRLTELHEAAPSAKIRHAIEDRMVHVATLGTARDAVSLDRKIKAGRRLARKKAKARLAPLMSSVESDLDAFFADLDK